MKKKINELKKYSKVMGAFLNRRRVEVEESLERVFTRFPSLEGTYRADRRDDERGRTTDARHRPRLDGTSQAPVAGRAVARRGADLRTGDSPGHRPDQPGGRGRHHPGGAELPDGPEDLPSRLRDGDGQGRPGGEFGGASR